jgi:NADH-quinone oxidoreductase subunit N
MDYDSFYNFLSISDWKFLVIGIIGLLFIGTKLIAKGSGFEVSALTFLLLLGSTLVVVSEHLIIIYLAIELQTFCVFILIAKNRDSLKGAEAALKYFILGAISSGVLLLGVSLLMAESSLLSLEALRSD